MTDSLSTLEARRAELLVELSRLGDMRKGSLVENYRRCGKPSCRCANPDDPGHGPYYIFTRKIDGKTRTVNLRPGPWLNRLRREVEAYQRFREICQQLIDLNEQICALRPLKENLANTQGHKLQLRRG